MQKLSTITLLLTFFVTVSTAQNLSIENVYKVALRNSDAIREGSEVKGYYFFYVSDKIDKKTNEYTLQITDQTLKKLKDVKFQDSKDVSIIESSFNGTDLIFLLYNDDARTFEYQVYGADGKKKYTYNRQLSKKEKRFLEASYLNDDEDKNYKGLYPVEGRGFISNMPSREEKDYTFQVDYFSTEKRKQWSYIPTVGAKRFIGDYLGTFNGVVYLEVLKFTGMMDQKPDSYLVGLDLETGKQLFEKSTEQGKFKFYPASMSVVNDGKAYIFGEYFNPNGNIFKDKSLGFGFWNVNEKGEVLSEKYNSWDLDMGKHLSVSSKGKIDDFGFMFLHNMVQTADGSIFAIGEGYQKTASALGIATTLLSRGGNNFSVLKMKVTDMILIRFDKDFNVKSAQIFDKNANKQELPSGYEFVSTPLIGKILRDYGVFDYSYTQMNKDFSSFTVCFSDYERGKDYKGTTFNAITYADGKITTDKIKTVSKASGSVVLPGKQGQVLILEYFKKDKRMEAHFEKLN
ncbi:MAG: hypothetical protein JNL59_03770 [Chitinophagaceae bacterium]|nr:hypothetical protein [Chitinophagaceae bacterium]